ncbi:unnamed protein product [Cercospora beticola]|nr:unnamed protein product [Cercospora beticola]
MQECAIWQSEPTAVPCCSSSPSILRLSWSTFEVDRCSTFKEDRVLRTSSTVDIARFWYVAVANWYRPDSDTKQIPLNPRGEHCPMQDRKSTAGGNGSRWTSNTNRHPED